MSIRMRPAISTSASNSRKPMSPCRRRAREYKRLGRISGVPPCAPTRRATTQRGAVRQRLARRPSSARVTAARSTGTISVPADQRERASPQRSEPDRPAARAAFSTMRTSRPRSSRRYVAHRGGVTMIRGQLDRGASIRAVRRNREHPRICASALGSPRRLEKPAARIRMRSPGIVRSFIDMMVPWMPA
jgi:hypothetical protein